jgi:hypothetical protein
MTVSFRFEKRNLARAPKIPAPPQENYSLVVA